MSSRSSAGGTNPGKGRYVSRSYLIAVVDDDDSFRMALAESLHLAGYDTREYASAEAFMAGDEEAPSDCVITDIRMPGMSGLELSHLLASRTPPVPVIMVTAVAGPNLRTKAAAKKHEKAVQFFKRR